jgi:hypothetical protein
VTCFIQVRNLVNVFTVEMALPAYSVDIALGYGLDDRGFRVRIPAGAGNFCLRHRVQDGSGAHPPYSPMGTRDSSAEVKECVKLYLHSPVHLHGVVFS